MNLLAFAVTDADGPEITANFYGFEIQLIEAGAVATVVIDSGEPPIATDDTLIAHNEVVTAVAAARACLPHRFGLIVDSERMMSDMSVNHDELVRALDLVRDRHEWFLRGRALASESAEVVLARTDDRPTTTEALDVGQWVHGLVADQMANDADEIARLLEASARQARPSLHGDGLGFDIDFLAMTADESSLPDEVDRIGRPYSGYIELELFGPTPPYRVSERLTASLR